MLLFPNQNSIHLVMV